MKSLRPRGKKAQWRAARTPLNLKECKQREILFQICTNSSYFVFSYRENPFYPSSETFIAPLKDI